MNCSILEVSQMRAIEAAAHALGMPYETMMENAGSATAAWLMKRYSKVHSKQCLMLVGKGKNGGDALIAAARLQEAGWQTTAVLPTARAAEDLLTARLTKLGGKLIITDTSADLPAALKTELKSAAFILDGLLGTGFRPPLSQELGQFLETLRAAGPLPPVIALDCPSGVSCEDGSADPRSLQASVTLCIEAVKAGLLKFPAANYTGRLKTLLLGLPEGSYAGMPELPQLLTKPIVKHFLPKRPKDGHKGSFGSALIIAGSRRYTGAAMLAGQACLHSGVGLCYMAVPASLHPALAASMPEAIWELLPEAVDGSISKSAHGCIPSLLDKKTAWLLGPGLGINAETQGFVKGLFLESLTEPAALPPLVVDADGLKLLAELENWPALLPPSSVLTPHPGEMAALCGLSINQVQAEREALAAEYAQKWNLTLVLKGAFTVVASANGREHILPFASSALAHGGSGDVLAGLICGLLAQGLEAFDAASLGVWLHAKAARLELAKARHTAAVLPSRLSRHFGAAKRKLQD